jgi:hypothetical protein
MLSVYQERLTFPASIAFATRMARLTSFSLRIDVRLGESERILHTWDSPK